MTGLKAMLSTLVQISTHTLTWSVTGIARFHNFLSYNFNSHAHVERDEAVYDSTDYFGISTHTLTWSVTIKETAEDTVREISTHTLTWSVTRV